MPSPRPPLSASLAALACLAVLAACTAAQAPESPRAFADRFIAAETKAWSTGDLDDLRALERDDVVFHLPGGDLTGWEAHADYIRQARLTLMDLRQEWTYLAGDGDVFALSYEASAVVSGPEGGAPSNLAVWMNGTSAAAQ